jgi:hypothetical protein
MRAKEVQSSATNTATATGVDALGRTAKASDKASICIKTDCLLHSPTNGIKIAKTM